MRSLNMITARKKTSAPSFFHFYLYAFKNSHPTTLQMLLLSQVKTRNRSQLKCLRRHSTGRSYDSHPLDGTLVVQIRLLEVHNQNRDEVMACAGKQTGAQ